MSIRSRIREASDAEPVGLVFAVAILGLIVVLFILALAGVFQ